MCPLTTDTPTKSKQQTRFLKFSSKVHLFHISSERSTVLGARTSNGPSLRPQSRLGSGWCVSRQATPKVEWPWLALKFLCTDAHLITSFVQGTSRPWSNGSGNRRGRRSCSHHLDVRARATVFCGGTRGCKSTIAWTNQVPSHVIVFRAWSKSFLITVS